MPREKPIDVTPIVRGPASRRVPGDLYHFLLTASWTRVLAILFVLYLAANVLFACAFLLGGDNIEHAHAGSFRDAFFFSVQTMATIGYGTMAPKTVYSHLVVTVEAAVGLIGFATATGLVFARFSRPTARVMFSKNAIIAPRDGVRSLMFRMANERSTQIVEAQLRLVLVRDETTREGEAVRRFHELALVRSQTAVFALSWTAIHPIDDKSPLFGATADDLCRAEATIVASLVGFDEAFAQTVHARHTYTMDAVLYDAAFVDVIRRDERGRRIVDYGRFHDVVRTTPAS
jgi:inward rectifier potassium channel